MATILVVDDNALFVRALSVILEGAGHEVVIANDGKVVPELVQLHHIDLVITDLIMPGREGIETIMALRRETPSIKIIAMSGGGRGDAEVYLSLARQIGAARTLKKPFVRATLLAAVDAVLKDRT